MSGTPIYSNQVVGANMIKSFKRRLDKFIDKDKRWLCRSPGLWWIPYVLMYPVERYIVYIVIHIGRQCSCRSFRVVSKRII